MRFSHGMDAEEVPAVKELKRKFSIQPDSESQMVM